MTNPKFEVYRDTAGEWRWRLRAANSEVVAAGEGYKTKAGALRGVQAMQRAVRTARVLVLEAAA